MKHKYEGGADRGGGCILWMLLSKNIRASVLLFPLKIKPCVPNVCGLLK